MYSYVTLVEVLERQAMINGYVFLFVALLMGIGIGLGVYFIRHFIKATDKANTTWFLYVGLSLFLVCLVGFVFSMWMSLARLCNPAYYAVEYIKELYKFKKFLELPF